MAERVGFEPTVPLPVRLISNQVRSTELRHLSAARQPSIIVLDRRWGAEFGAGSQKGFDPLGSSPNQISGRGRELLGARRPHSGNRQCRQDSGRRPLSNHPRVRTGSDCTAVWPNAAFPNSRHSRRPSHRRPLTLRSHPRLHHIPIARRPEQTRRLISRGVFSTGRCCCEEFWCNRIQNSWSLPCCESSRLGIDCGWPSGQP